MSNRCATYEEACEYLLAMVDYEKITRYKYDLATFNLSRTEDLLAAVGAPHRKVRCIHVAGTKGKGSTSTMIQTVLTGLGFRTGFFSSPHLVDLEERVTVDGCKMPRGQVLALVNEMRPYVDAVRRERPYESPTFFELMTALGFMHFAREEVDFAVIEVGMGGRLDSTNVILPEVSVITRVDFDHVKRLGPTLGSIAREKAGIIKEGVPVVSSPQEPNAEEVIGEIAKERNAPLFLLGRDGVIESAESFLESGAGGCRFSLRGLERTYPDLVIPIVGRHQAENAATAIMALEVLERRGLIPPDNNGIAGGLAAVRCPARIEVIPGEPLTILDGGHNPAAMRVLRRVMEQHLSGRRILLVFAIAADKDVEGVLQEILPAVSGVCVTRSDSPRSMAPDELGNLVRTMAEAPVEVFETATDALAAARAEAGAEDVICITGSLYLAGLLRPLLLPAEYGDSVSGQ